MSYIGNLPFGQTVRTVSSFTATSGQTTFYPTGGYTVGYVDVYLNGVRVSEPADYAATDGSSVVFTSGVTLGHLVEIVTYGTVSLADAVRRSGDVITGDITISADLTVSGNVATDKIAANGSLGTSGQVLISGGSGSNAYWTTLTSGSNTFGTISVSGQSDVVADSLTDTLTLANGNNIEISTDAGTDTVTVAANLQSISSNVTFSGAVKIQTAFIETAQNVDSNYTISNNYSAISAGPVTVANGVSVTIPSGSRWVIV